MFIVLALLISYALVTFGAVLPHSLFLLDIFWVIAIAAVLCLKAYQGQRLPLWLLIAFLCLVVLFWFRQPTWIAGLIALLWAWWATSTSPKGAVVFLRVLLIIGVFEAFLALVQFFVLPGWIFGYINPTSRSSGTLINRNHFAGLMEMLIPVALGLAYISARRFNEVARTYMYLLAGALMALALLASLSRMGILSFLFTLCFLGLILQWNKSSRKLAAGLALGLAGLVGAGALWIGMDDIVRRYSELMVGDALIRETRLIVFRDVVRMIAANPFGVGLDKFQDVFRQYQTFRPDLLFDHAHNDYLETAAEWGLPVAIAFWSFILFATARAVRLFVSLHSPDRGILLACIGGILAILIHSLTDFNLQIPSNAMLFFTFVGISLAMSRGHSYMPNRHHE